MTEEKIAILTPDTVDSTGQRVSLDLIDSPVLKEVLALRNTLRGTRAFPSRNEIRARDMARYLRNVTLYAVSATAEDFEYKIMGDAAVVAWGRSQA